MLTYFWVSPVFILSDFFIMLFKEKQFIELNDEQPSYDKIFEKFFPGPFCKYT